jgi:hypothetical protein
MFLSFRFFCFLRLALGITGLRQMGITAHVLILAGAAIDHNPACQSDAEGLDQARPSGVGRYQAIRVLGYSFRALIVARFAKQSTMKRRSSDAGVQA